MIPYKVSIQKLSLICVSTLLAVFLFVYSSNNKNISFFDVVVDKGVGPGVNQDSEVNDYPSFLATTNAWYKENRPKSSEENTNLFFLARAIKNKDFLSKSTKCALLDNCTLYSFESQILKEGDNFDFETINEVSKMNTVVDDDIYLLRLNIIDNHFSKYVSVDLGEGIQQTFLLVKRLELKDKTLNTDNPTNIKPLELSRLEKQQFIKDHEIVDLNAKSFLVIKWQEDPTIYWDPDEDDQVEKVILEPCSLKNNFTYFFHGDKKPANLCIDFYEIEDQSSVNHLIEVVGNKPVNKNSPNWSKLGEENKLIKKLSLLKKDKYYKLVFSNFDIFRNLYRSSTKLLSNISIKYTDFREHTLIKLSSNSIYSIIDHQEIKTYKNISGNYLLNIS